MQRLDVLTEDGDVVSRLEENSLAFKLDEGGVAPVLLKPGMVAKGVVQDGKTIPGRAMWSRNKRQQQTGEHTGQRPDSFIKLRPSGEASADSFAQRFGPVKSH